MAVQHGLQDLLDTVTGIGLTVILPGHNVLKQLPTGNPGETGTESPSQSSPVLPLLEESPGS